MNRFEVSLKLALCVCLFLTGLGCGETTYSYKNTTGKVANDLHMTLNSNPDAGGKVTSSAFSTPALTANVVVLNGGSVANSSSATVTFTPKLDTLNWVENSYWSDKFGNNIGATATAGLSGGSDLYVADAGSGNLDVLINNAGPPVAYDSLAMYTGADPQYYGTDQYLTQLSTGTTAGVTLLVPQTGTLASGTTLIALVKPAPSGYTGLSGNIDGLPYGTVIFVVPEPGSLALVLGGGAVLMLLRKKRRPSAT
jgi:hypothetical protein